MKTYETMKDAIIRQIDLDSINVWNDGLSKGDYVKIAPHMGLTWQEVKVFAEGRGLQLLLKMHNDVLEKRYLYLLENQLGERFAKDVTPQGFPWSQVEKTRDEIDDALWNRRLMIVNLLFEEAKKTLVLKARDEAEKARIKAVPKMEQSDKRRTLEDYRREAKELLKRKKL